MTKKVFLYFEGLSMATNFLIFSEGILNNFVSVFSSSSAYFSSIFLIPWVIHFKELLKSTYYSLIVQETVGIAEK